MRKEFIYWLRWLILIPSAIIAGLLSTFPLHWVLYTTLSNFVEPYPQLPERILMPLTVSAVFIWVGSRIAPDHKANTAVVLFGLWMFLVGGFVFLTLSGSNWMGQKLYFQSGGIGSIFAIIGAMVGFFLAWRKEEFTKKDT